MEEHTEVTSEKVLCWAKRVEAQRAQSARMNSPTETKEFNKVIIKKATKKYNPRRPTSQIQIPTKQTCRYFGSSHHPRQCPAYRKKCADCGKI